MPRQLTSSGAEFVAPLDPAGLDVLLEGGEVVEAVGDTDRLAHAPGHAHAAEVPGTDARRRPHGLLRQVDAGGLRPVLVDHELVPATGTRDLGATALDLGRINLVTGAAGGAGDDHGQGTLAGLPRTLACGFRRGPLARWSGLDRVLRGVCRLCVNHHHQGARSKGHRLRTMSAKRHFCAWRVGGLHDHSDHPYPMVWMQDPCTGSEILQGLDLPGDQAPVVDLGGLPALQEAVEPLATGESTRGLQVVRLALSGVRQLADGHFQGFLVAVAHHGHFRLGAGLERAHPLGQLRGALNFTAVEGDDHVAGLQAGARWGTAGVLHANQAGEMFNVTNATRQNELALQAGQINQGKELQLGSREFASSSANQAGQLQLTGMDQQSQMFQSGQNFQRDQMLLSSAGADLGRQVQTDQFNTQMEMSGLAQDRNFAVTRVGLETGTASDPLMAVSGRPSGAGTINTGALYAGGAQTSQIPQMFNPMTGVQFYADQNSNLNDYNIAYGNQQTQITAGRQNMVGNILKGAFSFIPGMAQASQMSNATNTIG